MNTRQNRKLQDTGVTNRKARNRWHLYRVLVSVLLEIIKLSMEQKVCIKYMWKMVEMRIPTRKVRDIQEMHQEKGMSGAAARTGNLEKNRRNKYKEKGRQGFA